jgi:glutathionylspermidine synthase
MQERDIKTLFKLWPWEWFADSDNGRQIPNVDIRILEPAWKMLWSNKGLLPVLWEIAPNHPNLLPAYFDSPAKLGDRYVRKPLYGREGANVTIFDKGKPIAEGQDQEYGEEGFVYQQFHHVPAFEGKYNPVLGIWMVRGYACGMGIRESQKQITDNLSRFVPHYFEPEN